MSRIATAPLVVVAAALLAVGAGCDQEAPDAREAAQRAPSVETAPPPALGDRRPRSPGG